MTQGEKAFIPFVKEKYPEFKDKTDEEILEERWGALNIPWFCFCSGWNAAFKFLAS